MVQVHNKSRTALTHRGDSGDPAFVRGYAKGLISGSYCDGNCTIVHTSAGEDWSCSGSCSYYTAIASIQPLVTNGSGVGLHLLTR
jgi:hypothetical protein